MKLKVLGMNGPWAAPGGAGSGYLLTGGAGDTVLLDIGPGVLARATEHIAIEKLSAVVVTHWHFDHMSDLLAMTYALMVLRKKGRLTAPLKVFAPPMPREYQPLLFSKDMQFLPMEPARLGTISLTFAGVRHPVPACAVRLEEQGRALVYTGDTNTSDGLAEFARGADLLLCDACTPESEWTREGPHLSALKAGQLAAAAEVKRLMITHMSPMEDLGRLLEEARGAFPGALLARDGLCVEIG